MRRNGDEQGVESFDPDPQVSGNRLVELDMDMTSIGSHIIHLLGRSTDEPDLLRTPSRYANFWNEFLDPNQGKDIDTTFRIDQDQVGQLAVVSGIKVWSMCEHHIIPYYVTMHIGYIIQKGILGLSKFSRIAREKGAGLTNQESLVASIGNTISEVTQSPHVMIIGTGVHLCMLMRGVKESEARFTVRHMTGNFVTDPDLKLEMYSVVNNVIRSNPRQ